MIASKISANSGCPGGCQRWASSLRDLYAPWAEDSTAGCELPKQLAGKKPLHFFCAIASTLATRKLCIEAVQQRAAQQRVMVTQGPRNVCVSCTSPVVSAQVNSRLAQPIRPVQPFQLTTMGNATSQGPRFATASLPDLAGRVFLITGGNSGLGLQSAKVCQY